MKTKFDLLYQFCVEAFKKIPSDDFTTIQHLNQTFFENTVRFTHEYAYDEYVEFIQWLERIFSIETNVEVTITNDRANERLLSFDVNYLYDEKPFVYYGSLWSNQASFMLTHQINKFKEQYEKDVSDHDQTKLEIKVYQHLKECGFTGIDVDLEISLQEYDRLIRVRDEDSYEVLYRYNYGDFFGYGTTWVTKDQIEEAFESKKREILSQYDDEFTEEEWLNELAPIQQIGDIVSQVSWFNFHEPHMYFPGLLNLKPIEQDEKVSD